MGLFIGKNLLKKIRHHKGHGIHSPFVYNLITKVIEEKSHYYAYSEIETKIKTASKNYNRLLFRLTNYFSCRSVTLFYPEDENSILYPAMVSHSTACCVVTDQPVLKLNKFVEDHHLSVNISQKYHPEINISTNESVDCYRLIVIEDWKEDETNNITDLLEEKTILIVGNIRCNKSQRKRWKTVLKHPSVGITLDMHSLGMVFVDKTFKKQHYKIYFNHGKK